MNKWGWGLTLAWCSRALLIAFCFGWDTRSRKCAHLLQQFIIPYISDKCLEMTYKIICAVKNNQVIVNLPPDFTDKKQVTIYVDDQVDIRSEKLEALKKASNDPLFLADIEEIKDDFDIIDSET